MGGYARVASGVPRSGWCVGGRVRPLGRVLGALAVVAAVGGAEPARAADYCYFPDVPPTTWASSRCATEITWPTVWNAVDAGMTETVEAGYVAGFNLFRDASNPGMYVAKRTSPSGITYLFFRMRVNSTTVNSSNGDPYTGMKSAFWMLTTSSPATNPKPTFSVAWDMQGVANHGLEMTYQSATYGSPALWNETNFSDVDGNSGQRKENDIDGLGLNQKEGYVRVVDGSPGSSSFIDLAVACTYFTRVSGQPNIGTFNPCTETFYSSAAVSSGINDNQGWTGQAANLDIFAIGAWNTSTQITSVVWGASFNPTAAVVTGIAARAVANGVEVTWETGAEIGAAGFHLHRIEPDGYSVRVTPGLVPALLESPNGGRYVVLDPGARAGGTATYVVEEHEIDGRIRSHGPFAVQVEPGAGAPALAGPAWLRSRRHADPGAARMAPTSHPDDGPRSFAATRRALPLPAPGRRSTSGGAAAHVVVSEPGLQVVTAAAVAQALGWTEGAARAAIRGRRLSVSGPEGAVPCEVDADGGRLFFVGQPLDTTWADTAVYRLERGACRAFDAVASRAPRGPVPAPTRYVDRAHVEEDALPLPLLFRQPWEDFWLWNQFVAGHPTLGTATYRVSTPWGTGEPGELAVNLQGETAAGPGRDHHVRVSLNGAVLGETRWTGESAATAAFTVPRGAWVPAAENEVRVEALLDPDIPYSVLGLDSIDVAWSRIARADGDRLLLPAGTTGEVVVDGFTGGDVWVLDLARAPSVRRVAGVATGIREGAYFARFVAPPGGGPLLVARTGAAAIPVLKPVPPRRPFSALRHARVDYLVITSPGLAGAAAELAAFREARGLRALVVETDQIYDEYRGGNLHPEAIRAFLSDVWNRWEHRPRFVALAGNGTWDGRDLLAVGDGHVPPLLAMGTRGLGPSDVALADVAGDDGVPEFAIGRIPAANEAELLAYVEKLRAREAGGSWSGEALFLADDPDLGGSFDDDSRVAAAAVAGALHPEAVAHAGDVADTRSRVARALSRGVGLFHYLGHASVERLANEGLLTSADVDALANRGRTPVALLLTCAAGRYGHPGYDALAMRLAMQPGGGAIAVVAPSSLQVETDSLVLGEGMLGAWASGRARTVGEAFVHGLEASRKAGKVLESRLTYTLFGDPAAELAP